MLKRLGGWLDSWHEFYAMHDDFVNLVKAILIAVCGISIIVGFIFWAISLDPDAPTVRWEGNVMLEDTRVLHCVRFHGGGVSCDWTHVSGGDIL